MTTALLQTIQGIILSVLLVVGIIVLIALHDVTSAVGIPILAGLTGVHIGAAVSGPAVPMSKGEVTTTTTQGPIQ